MKVVIQRVRKASVSVDSVIKGEISNGLLLLVGVTHEDTIEDINYLVNKVVNMRIFEDYEGKMNKSLKDNDYSILSISQFTLYAKTRKGNRPSFTDAASPDHALDLYNKFNEELNKSGVDVKTGVFGAHMEISLINDGPVTIVIDSNERK